MLRCEYEPQGEVVDAALTRKPSKEGCANRTKTDTGRQGENPKALEINLVKELGKLTP